MRAAVLGLGNVLMGDDGFGPAVVEALRARYEVPRSVELLDAGTPGLELLSLVQGLDHLVLVDTVETGDPPGTLRWFGRGELLATGERPRAGPHEPAVAQTLLTAELTDAIPRSVGLLGAVPDRLDFGAGLSAALRSVVPAAVEAVAADLRDCGFEVRKRETGWTPHLFWEEPTGRSRDAGGSRDLA